MKEVCFIADVAVLPGWLRVDQAIEFVSGIHPRFRPERARELLDRTNIKRGSRVRELSKGMITQLHLALVMAIDAKLLVLDEPTLGLDIIYRKQFYESLLGDYFDNERTIVLTTHQVEEVEHILTDLLFIDRGRVVLDTTMEQVAESYVQLVVNPDSVAAARELKPFYEREVFGRTVMFFQNAGADGLRKLGEARTPSVADLFVAKIKGAAA
jgi:ABC-2 type transport system ATP-binding protein